jgi:hypothetical protein
VTRPGLATLLAFLILLPATLPATAHAAESQVSIMMDDDNLLYRGDQVRDQTLQRMRGLGVDMVRVTVLWSVVTDKASRSKLRGARATNPRNYPTLNWDRYDRLVRSARSLGVVVYFNPTPPGPSWAHGKAPKGLRSVVKKAWKPDAGEFAKFVEALGKRFSGRYRDENDNGETIPRVSVWGLGNEPNQAGWLAPQWEKGQNVSASMYRELYLRSRAALDRTGHGRDTILVGELAPLGSSNKGQRSPVRPRKFLRTLLCLSSRGPGCDMFDKYGPIRATGFAHHPYTKNVSPVTKDKHPDSITLANLPSLGRELDRLAARTGNIRRGLPIWLTEFGFETSPPDPFSGVPLERQAEYNQLGELLAYLDPRVAGLTQFLLRDVAPVRGARPGSKPYWFTYQSGLEFVDGRPKPALQAYYFPFVVQQTGGFVANVWGQLRFRPNGLPPGAQDQVRLQFKPASGGEFADVGEPITVTSAMNYFTGRVQLPGPGELRAVWTGGPLPSRGTPITR